LGKAKRQKKLKKHYEKAAAATVKIGEIEVDVTTPLQEKTDEYETKGGFCINVTTNVKNCRPWSKGNHWMRGLPASKLGGEVNIPGTHDTFATHNLPIESGGLIGLTDFVTHRRIAARKGVPESDEDHKNIVVTQVLDLKKQLKLGLRAFDFRLLPDTGTTFGNNQTESRHYLRKGGEGKVKKVKKGHFWSKSKVKGVEDLTGLRIRMGHGHIMMPHYFKDELRKLLRFLVHYKSEFIILKYKPTEGLTLEQVEKKALAICQEFTFRHKIENPCLFETLKKSGKWASTLVGNLRGKVVFWPKDALDDKGEKNKKTTNTKEGRLQRFSKKNAARTLLGASYGTINKKLGNYFLEAWKDFHERNGCIKTGVCKKTRHLNPLKPKKFNIHKTAKEIHNISMFYLSATLAWDGMGPICLATGKHCALKTVKWKKVTNKLRGKKLGTHDTAVQGLNNLMLDTLENNDGKDMRGLGLVMMDFPGADLVKAIAETNNLELKID